MSKSGAYVVNFTRGRYEELLHELEIREFFAEAVPDFAFSRRQALVAIVVSPAKEVTHIGRAKKGVKAGTNLRRLNLLDLIELDVPLSLHDLLDNVPNRVRHKAKEILQNGGLLAPKAFLGVVDAIVSLRPEAAETLERFSTTTRQRLRELSNEETQALALQKEAVATALSFSGLQLEPLAHWELDKTSKPISYLEGLEEARMMEDSMITWDLHQVPGFDEVRSLPHASTAVFSDDETTLFVTLANKQPLEKQTGTDLIYFNQTFGAFVMVQYKAMELDEHHAAFFRFPQKQLDAEIVRMDSILAQLNTLPKNGKSHSFRLSENPFFLKFCPRIQFDPDSASLTSGMYIPLDYWKMLADDPNLEGPRGGKLLTYKNVGRFVDNSSFVTLVAKAWVGTSITASAILSEWIEHIVGQGRSVAFAIKKEDDDDGDTSRGYVFDPSPHLGLAVETPGRKKCL
ncbi:hypothetical protein [uncultured Sulfitobacter sp.]|uniref:hypothetical protein n=1 Tax=uncultured Sulfitobacter sp. TaxID=191468 RepID=UPI0030D7FF4D|tara:strand:- start:9983 stop:11356 length:1374 start_codon:yes stop_codon:yes gene_type:complete